MAGADTEHYIVAIAFGTRGDIVPILSVLHGIICKADDAGTKAPLLIIITHRCFQNDIHAHFLGLADVIGIDTSPIATIGHSESKFRNGAELNEVLCSLEHRNMDRIVSNLFGLEAWGVAIKLNVPYVIIHPNCPNTDALTKSELLNDFQGNYALECNILRNRKDQRCGLHWSDFDLWLWPTLVGLDAQMAQRIMAYDKSVTVLILSSPTFEKECAWPSNHRYHLCGFVGDGHLSEHIHLQPNNQAHKQSGQSLHVSSLYEVCHDVQELLRHTHSDAHETSNLICVDFGSMTQVLHESGELGAFLRLLERLCDTWRFVIVCHGYVTSVQSTLQQIKTDRSSCHSTTTTQSTGTPNTAATAPNTSPRILLIPHSVPHNKLFPQCITVIHHGGIGTTGACMRAGIPQFILSVMYDQHSNGQRVQELNLGLSHPFDTIIPTLVDTDLQASVRTMKAALMTCTHPAQRLRCACVGTKMRSNPAEDGVNNAVNLLWEQVRPTRRSKGIVNVSKSSAVMVEKEFNYSPIAEDLLVLPNGLQTYAHWKVAPEETVFLYEEIFERVVYKRGVGELKPGDLVVDVGANIGMFALYVAHYTQTTSVNNELFSPEPVQIIAIEPIQANFTLLQQNMQLHHLHGRAYCCAIGACSFVTANEESAVAAALTRLSSKVVDGSGQSVEKEESELSLHAKTMLYYPRMPGNSCSLARVAANTALQEAHMNHNVLHAAQVDCTEEKCAIFTLSDILNHSMRCVGKDSRHVNADVVGIKRPAEKTLEASEAAPARRVALLKIDVEGDELEVLQSLQRAHWVLIDRIIVESHPDHVEEICTLLQQEGFSRNKMVIEKDGTGNVFIYASRV